MTMALTQTQWRIVAVSVWATAQAVRPSISCLLKEKALVSSIPSFRLGSWKEIK